jgi:hypothetical protein
VDFDPERKSPDETPLLEGLPFTGAAPEQQAITFSTAAAGDGGPDSDGGASNQDGAGEAGQAADSLSFD